MTPQADIEIRDVDVTLGDINVLQQINLVAEAGSRLAILGPSGCGKTTLLRVIAGLQSIDRGEVSVAGTVVAGSSVHVPPENRNIGMVFQDWALFPHLTVMQNILFGLPRAQRKSPPPEVRALLDMVGIADLADRNPGSLSGGQQQRVAVARALAPRPAVLLLDEPFSSLDTSLRVDVRTEVAELLKLLGVTSIFVTHDQDEAFVLGEHVAVMRDGNVVQSATPAELYARPTDRWLANFVGEADTITGVASGTVAQTDLGPIPLHDAANGTVDVLVRPEEIRLRAGGDSHVTRVEFFGHDTLYGVATAGGDVLRSRMTGSPKFDVGTAVTIDHSGSPAIAFE
ncbi:MAG: ABC transporter ATP-binding protein [Acidimicrobiales bacterium]|nr:ABC transporter ATP-binding protein [Acidimicrobiales bacterium]RZV45310.1 MAG: ABC transporter ATP-binding protein [Acidimicrobiales bacterium]